MIRFFFTRQFFRFLLVGGLAAILHWCARLILSNWLPFSWAVVFAYAVGMSVAFTLNIVFVFPNSPKSKIKQARDFALVNISFFPVVWAVSVLINNGLLASGMLKYTQEVSHAVAVILPTFLTFLIYKLFAFKDSVDER